MPKRLVPALAAAALVAGSLALPAQAEEKLQFAVPANQKLKLAVSPEAASWKPAVIRSVDAYLPPAPPAVGTAALQKELAELKDWEAKRTGEDLQAIAYWNDLPAPLRWSEEVRSEIITASMVPPRAARALAVVHTAMYDAMLVAWKAKAKYQRPLPAQRQPYLKPVAGDPGIPSYPSEHAAIAMAAAVAMGEIFPDHRADLLKKARLVGETRIASGANYRSDVEAGFKIGEQVAQEILKGRAADGSEKKQLTIPKQAGKWWVATPMEPLAGSWGTWLMKNGQQFRMKYDIQPMTGDNPVVARNYQEVADVHQKLTPHQIERAIYWNFDVPALLWQDLAHRAVKNGIKPAKPDSMGIMWSDIARQAAARANQDTPHAARMLSVLHQTLADSFIGCWDTKYANLVPRPYMVAPKDKPLETVVPTPPHPSWPSGHATASASAAVILSAYFPKEKESFWDSAREAAMSRLWGGIHFRKDNDDGLRFGTKIGEYDLQQARAKGWLN